MFGLWTCCPPCSIENRTSPCIGYEVSLVWCWRVTWRNESAHLSDVGVRLYPDDTFKMEPHGCAVQSTRIQTFSPLFNSTGFIRLLFSGQ